MVDIWGLIDGTARFPARPPRYAERDDHRPHVGWYEGDVPCCGRCGCAMRPGRITRGGIGLEWKHMPTPAETEKEKE